MLTTLLRDFPKGEEEKWGDSWRAIKKEEIQHVCILMGDKLTIHAPPPIMVRTESLRKSEGMPREAGI